jgi:RNA polymerase sigma-70 factor (ECF subfamily)
MEFNSSLIKLKPRLQGLAIKLTSNSDRARDLVQDTYLKALISREQFHDYTNLGGWVFTIMKNSFINNYRRSLKKNTMIDDSAELYYINQQQVMDSISPESDYLAGEIQMAIDSLSKEFKEPFMMCLEGYRYKEIADKLHLNIGTVKSRIFLTRQKLMIILKDYKK